MSKKWIVCSKCGRKSLENVLPGDAEVLCCSCAVASWSPEKREAIRSLISAAVRGDKGKLSSSIDAAIVEIRRKGNV